MTRTTQKDISLKFMRVVKMIRSYWFSLTNIMLAGLVIQSIVMAVPYFSQLLIDRAYPSNNVSLMQVLVAAIVGINVATVIMRNTRSYFNHRLSARLNNTIALLFFNHVQHLPLRFFDGRRTGEIMSRFQDINTSVSTVTNALQTFLMNGIYLVLVPPSLFIINWKLAVLALFTIPFNAYVTYRLGHASRPYLKKTAETFGELRGVQIEVIDNIKILKTLAIEDIIYRKVETLMLDSMKFQLKASRVGVVYGIINGFVRATSTALYMWFGWHMIFSGQLSLGEFIAFTAYVGYIYTPISELVALFSDLQQSSVSFNRMFEYLDTAPEQEPNLTKSRIGQVGFRLHGNIELKNVRFGYVRNRPVLKDINISIKEGTINALVGPSGSGKSSLLRLVTGLDRPDSGKILIGGTDISQIPLSDLRRQLSVVWQEGGLIKGSIMDNLTLGSESPPLEWVKKVVSLCRLEELIESLPNKYDTEIAEKGSTLSAGQRQRIAIARALIRQTPILILDEATANIDISTEMEILNKIFAEFRSTTIIFVSHRLSSASLADNIFIIDSGEIVEAGTPDKLLALEGMYYKMCQENKTRRSEEVLVGAVQ